MGGGGGGLVDQKNDESWVHLGGGSDSPWTLPVDLLLNIMYVLYTVFSTYLGAQIGKGFILFGYSGLLIFREKKSKISRDFQGQIRRKIGRFHGIFAGEKSKFAGKSFDFAGF